MTTTLVVPSNRPESIQSFFEAWKGGDWDEIIVVEDAPTKSFALDPSIIHVAWDDIEHFLGKENWIISRQDSAIRCYGFFLAWMNRSDYIITLDDDCYPGATGSALAEGHRHAMQTQPKWIPS